MEKLSFSFVLSILLIISSFSNSFGQLQNFKLDYNADRPNSAELKKLIAQSPRDTSRVRLFILCADSYLDQPEAIKSDMDSAFAYLNKAIRLSRILQSRQGLHDSRMQLAQYYAEIKNQAMRIATYKTAITDEQNWGEKRMEAESRWFQYINTPSELNDSALARVKKGYELSKKFGKSTQDKLREASFLKEIADLHLISGKLDLALEELTLSISIQKKYDNPDIYFSYDLLSGIYKNKGDLTKALYFALQAVKLSKQTDIESLPYFLQRVADTYSAIGNYKEAENWYQQTYQLRKESGQDLFVATSGYTQSLIENGKADLALKVTQSTWEQYKNSKSPFLDWVVLSFAESYTALGQHKKAQKYINSLLKTLKNKDTDEELRAEIHFLLGTSYSARRQYDQALYYLMQCSINKANLNLYMRMKLQQMLADVRLTQKMPAEAIQNFKEYHRLRDSVFTVQRLEGIDRLQVEFSTSQKENENEILRKKSQLQQQELEQSDFLKKTTLAGIAVLLLLVILIYSRFRLKNRVNKLLIKQKSEVDQINSELEISVNQKNKLIAEKEGLIREVHHRVKNNLQLTMSLLNSQSYYLKDATAKEAIKQSQHRLKSIALIHQKLYQNDSVGNIDIKPYIHDLVEYLSETLSDGKSIQFEVNLVSLEMDVSKAVPFGLFINEAITNIFKYAFPNSTKGIVKLSLQAIGNNKYQLTIKDNGIGLPTDFSQTNIKTLGLTLMNGLSKQIGGDLTIKNNNGVWITLIFENCDVDELTEQE